MDMFVGDFVKDLFGLVFVFDEMGIVQQVQMMVDQGQGQVDFFCDFVD